MPAPAASFFSVSLKAKNLARMRQRATIDDAYVDMIVYQTAAAKLSKSARNEHLACYGYAQLRLYEDVIRSCSEVLDNDDNIQAHYWRGIAYRYTKQLPAALRDLETVADSNDPQLQTIAAIQISYIYLDMKDFKSLLDVIDAHRFLFDPMWAGFAYESRCRAHMELGDLQKALGDCTAALQIVSSPEVQSLQRELMERLGKQKPTAAATVPPPERAQAQQPSVPSRAPDRYPHLSSQVIDDIKTKVRTAGFEPNAVAVVYDLKDWHEEFGAAHHYAKTLDVPMPSLKEAVEVLAHFARKGLGFAGRFDRPPRFHVMLVDNRGQNPSGRVVNKQKWGIFGISLVQAHNVAELQETMRDSAPDVILIAETLPEPIKADIRSKVANVPTVMTPVPAPRVGSQAGMSGPMSSQTPEEAAYEQAVLDFEEAVFDAVQKIIPAGMPVYVSFATK